MTTALALKSVEPRQGARWVRDALRLFARRPLSFMAMFVVFMMAAIVVSLLPLIGGVLQMMSLPLLSLGFMVASQSALLNGPVQPLQFIEPLRGDPARRRALLVLCALYGVTALAILYLVDEASGGAWARLQPLLLRGQSAQAEIETVLEEPALGMATLIGAVLASGLSLVFWHAPALVHWGGQSVGQALFSSTLALWRSKGAFLVYLLVWLGLSAGFMLLVGLLFELLGAPDLAGVTVVPAALMFTTVFYVSLLFSFNDSFASSARASPGG
jgi:hypothetical protein